MKRCKIQLPQIRISKPGHDVDTASLENLLFHESFLFSQPYHFTFVPCPFAGYVGNDDKDVTVAVTIPAVTPNPIVLMYPVSSESMTIYPRPRSYGSGSDQSGYAVDDWTIGYNVVHSARIDIRFNKSIFSRLSPQGVYLMLMRDPINA